MMMNFLDLSAASDEERRLISEILSDTSVVNFAQPLRQQQSLYNNQQQLQQLQQDNQSRQQDQQHHHQNQQPNQHIVKSKATHSPYQQTQQQQQQQQQQHQQSQIQQNCSPSTNSTNDPNNRLNHVHNHNAPVTSENHHQPNHVQMPSPMAGDINQVVGMDMSASQHAGYQMGHPTSAHVTTTYGPPPPHHMYGGPPIFQPYPMPLPYPNIVYGNMPHHYPLLLATNSVVPPRQQQAPPQSNQPPNANIANSSYSRSHSHHPRQVKLKDQTSKQNSLHHNQQHVANNPNAHHIQYVKPNNNSDVNEANTKTSASNQDDFKPETISNHMQDSVVVPVDDISLTNNDVSKEPKADCQQAEESAKTEDNSRQTNNEVEVTEIKSDESVEAQASRLEISKSSTQNSSIPMVVDETRSDDHTSEHESNNENVGQQTLEPSESNKLVSHNIDEKEARQGPWGSASSKSWASLFKGDGSALLGSPSNDDSDNNNADLNNFDEDSDRNSRRKTGNLENNIAQNSTKAVTSKEQRSQDAARKALDKMAPRLAQKINSITLKHSLPLLRPRGFINKGNGCYINSTLQALIACPPFYNLMKEIGDLKCLRRENSCTPILDSFAELFLNFPPLDANKKNKQFTSSDQRTQLNYLQAEALEPKCIYDVLGQIKSECLKGAQEDAEEFLSSVLNGLHEEMIGLSETLQSNQNNNLSSQNGHQSDADDLNGDTNNDENVWREVGPKNRSLPIRTATVVNTPIQEIFGGSLFSIRTAGKDRCGHRSPFFDLQLDISGDNVKSLPDAIKSFTAPEIIHDFYCSKTKQKLDAQCRTSLDQLPPILILHLKQFIYTQDHGLKKLMKRIEYPIDFELPDSCLHDKISDRSQRTSRTYKLLAVVYHEGKEAVKGHYLTDVYHIGSSQWIRCDDSNLKVVPAPRIDSPDSSRTPYLLFYRRYNTLKPPQSNNGNSQHDNSKKKS